MRRINLGSQRAQNENENEIEQQISVSRFGCERFLFLAKITHRPRKLCAERALMQFNCTYLFVRITKFRSQHKHMFIPDRISSRMKWATICKLVKCCRTIIAKSYERLNKYIHSYTNTSVGLYFQLKQL